MYLLVFPNCMRTTGNAIPDAYRAHRCARASLFISSMTPPTRPAGAYPPKTAPGSLTAPTTDRARMHKSVYLQTHPNTRQNVAIDGSGGG